MQPNAVDFQIQFTESLQRNARRYQSLQPNLFEHINQYIQNLCDTLVTNNTVYVNQGNWRATATVWDFINQQQNIDLIEIHAPETLSQFNFSFSRTQNAKLQPCYFEMLMNDRYVIAPKDKVRAIVNEFRYTRSEPNIYAFIKKAKHDEQWHFMIEEVSEIIAKNRRLYLHTNLLRPAARERSHWKNMKKLFDLANLSIVGVRSLFGHTLLSVMAAYWVIRKTGEYAIGFIRSHQFNTRNKAKIDTPQAHRSYLMGRNSQEGTCEYVQSWISPSSLFCQYPEFLKGKFDAIRHEPFPNTPIPINRRTALRKN